MPSLTLSKMSHLTKKYKKPKIILSENLSIKVEEQTNLKEKDIAMSDKNKNEQFENQVEALNSGGELSEEELEKLKEEKRDLQEHVLM